MEYSEQLTREKKITEDLLFCKNDFFCMKKSVEDLHEIFSAITLINAYQLNDDAIVLPGGKAISPASAAHCLLEFKRTAVFLRGIFKAISDLIEKEKNVIQVLYAGCGPYSTLLLPLFPFFNSSKLKVTLVDINKISLNSSKKLIASLGLEDFIEDYFLDDLTTFKVDKPYSLVVSETMQSCLENEPQIHIMRNIIPQLKKDTIFIPQEIRVDFYASNFDLFFQKSIYENRDKNIQDKIYLNNFFTINKDNVLDCSLSGVVNNPAGNDIYMDLGLFTFIKVYNDEELRERECSLNIPKRFTFSKDSGSKLKFWLDITGMPKVNCITI